LFYRGHYIPFDTAGIITIQDHIRNVNQSLTEFVGDRNGLKNLPLWWNSGDQFICISNKIRVEMTFENDTYDASIHFYPIEENEPFSRIIEVTETTPFGINSEDRIIEKIKEIAINGIKAPTIAFSDLVNPNKYETYLAIKPIDVFTDEIESYIYIYIFGKPNLDLMILQDAMEFSYMAKLIFSIDGQYIGRIVERGEILKYFGFDQCPYFIGF
jgi:hypothetical protein